MADWDLRFGWIIPSWNTVNEYEVERLTPPDASHHFMRIAHTEDTPAAFDRMGAEAPTAADLLAHAKMDAICYACTAGSFYRGLQYDRALATQLAERTGRPVVTMAHSLIDGARALGMQRIAVAAPYEGWLMDLLVKFLEEAGLKVLNSANLGHQANVLYPPSKAIELAQRAWHPDADGLIMSCGNFRTLEAIDEIEKLLGKPVVTSIQASFWALFHETGTPLEQDGAGVLLRGGAVAAEAQPPAA
jgi:maleate isomerase